MQRSGKFGELRTFGNWLMTLSDDEYKKEFRRRSGK